MFRVKKEMVVSIAHHLDLPYESKCNSNHGHNIKIIVYCESRELNSNGMVIDFTEIKKTIHDVLDHKDLNVLFDFNPTAENLASWIWKQIWCCYRVDVQETDGNVASYVDDTVSKVGNERKREENE